MFMVSCDDENCLSKLATIAYLRLMRPSKLLILLLIYSATAAADIYTQAVRQLDFESLMHTFSETKVNRILDSYGKKMPDPQRQAAAVLISAGAFDAADLQNPEFVSRQLASYIGVMTSQHPALVGRIGDAALLSRMISPPDYSDLLAANDFLDVLGEELSNGVITGYDLRMKGVYDGFSKARTFIYSHSSLLHARQLVALLNSEDINGWVYITPKVSAFLYREDWGSPSPAVVSLPSGVRVVQGREIALMFHFDTAEDRNRFHEVVTRYAKKDTENEPGLIENSWWQPFYYTDSELQGFESISLVVATSDRHEATLTVLDEKTQDVVDALADKPWSVRVDKVWVNPPFFRFLGGGYK